MGLFGFHLLSPCGARLGVVFGSRVWGVWGLGFRVYGVWGLGFRV